MMLLDTLIHECLHAIYEHYELSKKDDEERVVATLSHGLTALFVDNPKLIDYIKGALK